MAGTLVANTINTDTGLFSTNNAYLGMAKAWISWNPNTQTTYGSFNVTSITYLSSTHYQINFTTAMANANYATALASCDSPTISTVLVVDQTNLPTTSALTLYTNNGNVRSYFSAIVIGN